MAGLIEDKDGNLNIDFLIGLVLFLSAFLYLIVTIPGIFLPYQTNSIDLGSVVYRTSCLLAEDPGWYVDDVSGDNGIGWESRPVITDDLARVGLAVDKRTPNVLSLEKIKALEGVPYLTSQEKMGLENTLSYNYSLKITMLTPEGGTAELLNIDRPWLGGNVESIDRMVLIREGQGLYYDASTIEYPAMNLIVGRTPSFDRTNITVRLENFVPSDGSTGRFSVSYYVGPYYSDDALVQALPNNEYYIMKNNERVDPDFLDASPFNIGDKIDIIVDLDKITSKYTTQGLNISRLVVYSTGFAPFRDLSVANLEFEDYNTTNPYYRYFDSNGIMTLKVWEA